MAAPPLAAAVAQDAVPTAPAGDGVNQESVRVAYTADCLFFRKPQP
jgi:hypothetical protein